MRGVLLLALVGALAVPAVAAAGSGVVVETRGGFATVSWAGGFGETVVSIRRSAEGPVIVSSETLVAGRTAWEAPVRLAPGRYTAVVSGGCPPPQPGLVSCLGMWGAQAEFVVQPYRPFAGGRHLD